LVDGESCEDPFVTFGCGVTCVVLGGECGLSSQTIYSGITEKTCSPEGCPGDCNKDTEWCYKVYTCEPSGNYTWADTCTNIILGEGGLPITLLYYFCSDIFPIPTKCYSCEPAPNPTDIHYVEKDSCN
jgi:hypothetical protein